MYTPKEAGAKNVTNLVTKPFLKSNLYIKIKRHIAAKNTNKLLYFNASLTVLPRRFNKIHNATVTKEKNI